MMDAALRSFVDASDRKRQKARTNRRWLAGIASTALVLILVGVALVGEGLRFHIPKGYIYFAMAFAVGVEMLNLRLRRARTPIKLHKEIQGDRSRQDGDRR